MNLTRRQSIWRIADHVRTLLNFTEPPFDPERLIACLGGHIEYLTLKDAEQEGYGPDFEAELQTTAVINDDPRTVEFKVTVAGWKSDQRIRFSIAHEIGHLILHLLEPGGTLKAGQVTYRNLQSSEEELEANEFAAAFLMPTDLFAEYCQNYAESHNGEIDITAVAKEFDVSTSAATVRGSILSLW